MSAADHYQALFADARRAESIICRKATLNR